MTNQKSSPRAQVASTAPGPPHNGQVSVAVAMGQDGAEIDLSSAPDQGTTVRIAFPVPMVPEVAGTPMAVRPASSHLRVLLIDDDPLILKALRTVLDRDGHTVVSASGGQEGIDAFRQSIEAGERYSLVITDLGMPHRDGRQVAGEVKRISPTTPVIFLSGWGSGCAQRTTCPRRWTVCSASLQSSEICSRLSRRAVRNSDLGQTRHDRDRDKIEAGAR